MYKVWYRMITLCSKCGKSKCVYDVLRSHGAKSMLKVNVYMMW